MLYPAELLVQMDYLSFSKEAVRASIPRNVEAKKKPMAFISPAKLIYLSMVEVIVIPAIVKDTIDNRKGKMFNLTDMWMFLRVKD